MDKVIQVYPFVLRMTHMGLAIFGITAYLTGELAEEAEHGFSAGYWLHTYLGLTMTVFLVSHVIYKITTVEQGKSRWWFSKGLNIQAIKDDLHRLSRFRLPDRDDHSGIAGLVQLSGLLIFSWMAITGIILFFLGDPEGSRIAHTVSEVHEIGGTLIPVFLFLHVGAVILHSLSGYTIWKRMNPFSKQVNYDLFK